MAHHGMRDVILTDDGDPEPGEGASRAPGDPGRATRIAQPAPPDSDVPPAPRRRRRRWALVSAVALAVTLVVVLVVDGVTDRRRAARLADLPGVLEPMSASLRVLWSRPGGWQHPAVHGPDVMVSLFEDPGRRFRLVANDIVTGEQRWDVAVPDLQFWGDLSCHALGADTTGVSTHIICRRVERAEPESALPAYGPKVRASLVVLDAHTGATVGHRVLDYGFGTVEPFGADVLVTTVLEDGRVRLTREDLLTGEARWAVVSQAYPGSVGQRGPYVATEHGVVVVDGPFGMVVSADGELLGEWPPPTEAVVAGPEALPVDITVLADGRIVVGGSDLRPDVPYGAVVTADGDEQFVVDGVLLTPGVDDGSAADLLLTVPKRQGGIAAVDRLTGERVWTAEATPRAEAVLLDHRLITTLGNDVIAVDTRSGRRLWTADHSRGDHAWLTDGHVLLIPTVPTIGESSFTALSVADGRVLWTASAPPDVVAFFPIGGRLIALQQEQMMRLGPAPADS